MIFRVFFFFSIVSYVTVPAFSLPFSFGDWNIYPNKGNDVIFAPVPGSGSNNGYGNGDVPSSGNSYPSYSNIGGSRLLVQSVGPYNGGDEMSRMPLAEREAYIKRQEEEKNKKNNAHITNDNSNGSHHSAGVYTSKGDDNYGNGPGGRDPSPGSHDGELDEKTNAIVVRDDSVYPSNTRYPETTQNQPGLLGQALKKGKKIINSFSNHLGGFKFF